MSSELSARYQQLMRRVTSLAAQAPEPRAVTLLAVSKTQPVEAIQSLYSLGHRDFGENYAQELAEKAEKLKAAGCTEIRWHFIGHLQTNKVKAILPFVHAVHSVDSERLGRELAKRWTQLRGEQATPLPIFIEVNLDREESKSGALPEEAPALAATLAAERALSVQGLMAIPSAGATPEATSQSFARLRELERSCRPHTAGQLSMGMSGDFELAIPQGATHIRVGTALFGARPPKT